MSENSYDQAASKIYAGTAATKAGSSSSSAWFQMTQGDPNDCSRTPTSR